MLRELFSVERPPRPAPWLALGLVLIGVVFALDYVTGSELAFSFFYLIPIAVVTWQVSGGAGVAYSLLCTVAWVSAYVLTGGPYSNPRVIVWNSAVEVSFYLTVTLTLSEVHRGLEKERILTDRLKHAHRLLDEEIGKVGDLQREMMAHSAPAIRGYDLATYYATCTRAGGDYFDFFPLPEGRFGLVIADVAGHGAQAAMVMAMIRVLLRAGRASLESPDRVLTQLHYELTGNIPSGLYATACYAVIHPESGRIDYSIAGHNPPLVVRSLTRAVEAFENPAGPPLALMEDPVYTRHTCMLEAGDTVLFCTDGLVEAADAGGGLLGIERVEEILASWAQRSPDDLRDRLVAAAEFQSGTAFPTDDLTLVVLRAKTAVPAASPRALNGSIEAARVADPRGTAASAHPTSG